MAAAQSTRKGCVVAPVIGQVNGGVAATLTAATAAATAAAAWRNFHADDAVFYQLFHLVFFQKFLALIALVAAHVLVQGVQRYAVTQNVLETVVSHATIVSQAVFVTRLLLACGSVSVQPNAYSTCCTFVSAFWCS